VARTSRMSSSIAVGSPIQYRGKIAVQPLARTAGQEVQSVASNSRGRFDVGS